ncbi:alpha/beta fold hydrolase [Pseudonocardia sp. GCM10023141]|uniref:alpha/beta fold hydrolase n=1 Tax=Pseudonocardia sp. GCM10023141 TaxID=3252653 RepID=UPI00362375E2
MILPVELKVPGARLSYEVRGEGPLWVVVPGAAGDRAPYQQLAVELSGRYRVVTYDRRGFSRSQLHGAQDYAHRFEVDADDVARLIGHLGAERATVFGNSSGALVALQVLIDHPGVVERVIAHEPPAVRLLPDGEDWVAFFDAVYDTYRAAGPHPALRQFSEGITGGMVGRGGVVGHRRDPDTGARPVANLLYWFERELRQYPRVELDVPALAAYAHRIVLAGGVESKQFMTYQPATVLATALETPILDLPGGHLGLLAQPAEFALELLAAVAQPSPRGGETPAPREPR